MTMSTAEKMWQCEDHRLAASYGFVPQPLAEPLASWIATQTRAGKIVGVWDGALHVHCDPAQSGGRLLSWTNAGNALAADMAFTHIAHVWAAFDYFSKGELDAFVVDHTVIEFPVLAHAMFAQWSTLQQENADDTTPQTGKIATPDILPDDAFTKNLIGKIFGQRKNFAQAASALRQAVEQMPEFGEPYSNLGVLLWNLGQRREALIMFTEGMTRNPHLLTCQLNFLDAVHEMEDYQLLHNMMHELAPLFPMYPEFLLHAAMAHKQLGDAPSARALLEPYVHAHPQDADAKSLLEQL